MIIEPFVFCLKAEFNRSEDKPEEMGRAMFICIAAGVLAIVNTLLLSILSQQEIKLCSRFGNL